MSPWVLIEGSTTELGQVSTDRHSGGGRIREQRAKLVRALRSRPNSAIDREVCNTYLLMYHHNYRV